MDFCDNYVIYVKDYATDSVEWFHRYLDFRIAANVVEQNHRAQHQNVSQYILFELRSQLIGNQHSILANRQNNVRLIAELMKDIKIVFHLFLV